MLIDAATVAIGAGVTAITKVVAESGIKWVAEKFKDHPPAAQEAAKENFEAAYSVLAEKLAVLSERSDYNEALLERALTDPSVGTLLQKALGGAAQTAIPEKHDLLARLIAQRLQGVPESLIALVSPKACDAILYCTVPQIRILAFSATTMFATPLFHDLENLNRRAYLAGLKAWFEPRFTPFIGMKTNNNDFMHLDGLSCGAVMIGRSMPVNDLLANTMSVGDNTVHSDDLLNFQGGADFIRIWNEELMNQFLPTTVGKLVGLMAADALSGTTTDMTNFGESGA